MRFLERREIRILIILQNMTTKATIYPAHQLLSLQKKGK